MRDALTPGFLNSMQWSLKLSVISGALALVLGLVLGTLFSLYTFRGKYFLTALFFMPLLVPSYLLSLGLLPVLGTFDILGSILTSVIASVPIVFGVILIEFRLFSKSSLESLFVTRTKLETFKTVVFLLFPTALSSAVLSQMMQIADPGGSTVFNQPGIGTELLTSFSALYDYRLTLVQVFFCSVVVGMIAFPFAYFLNKRMGPAEFSKATPYQVQEKAPCFVLLIFIGWILFSWGLPVFTLSQKVFGSESVPSWIRALADLKRVAFNTILYSGVASLTAVLLGGFLVFAMGKSLPRLFLGLLPLWLSLPSFGFAFLALASVNLMPPEYDFLFRSRIFVGIVSGIKYFPLAGFLFLIAKLAVPMSWHDTLKLYKIPTKMALKKIWITWYSPYALMSFLVVGLLSFADVSIPLILRPPGEDSLPTTLLTVIANAPEKYVSCLALISFGVATAVICLMSLLGHLLCQRRV